jgi:Cellulose biosynthesis protein BcsS
VRVMGGVAAACFVAVSMLCGLDCAFAETAADGADSDHYLLFGGSDLWRSGGFLHGGVLASPGGLLHEGFTFKLLFGGGVYRYQTGGTEIRGETALAAAMPGWRFKYDRLEITAVAGLDVQAHHLTPDDPGNKMRGTHAGLRVGADLWYQPNDAMMVAAAVSASTIGPNYWTRVATGWRLLDWAWVGPEALALGGSNYQQVRLGVHATAFKTGQIEWSTGFGYVHDSDHHAGLYGRIGLLTRR